MKKKSNKTELQESIDMIFEKECGGGLRRLKTGRKIKPNVKKKAKSFTLSVEAQNGLEGHVLADMGRQLDLAEFRTEKLKKRLGY